MSRLEYVAKGTLAGAVATVPMSAVMLAAQRAGYLGELPPDRITGAVLKAMRVRATPGQHDLLSFLNHFAFGATAGATYAGVRDPGPRPAPDILAGIAFGLTVWLVSYEGWVPKFGILPNIQWDRPGRPESMAAAHAVFGGTLAALLRRLDA